MDNQNGTSNLSKEVWGLFLQILHQRPAQFANASQAIGLSMGQARALLVIPPGQPLPMKDLAEKYGSDPSHITRLVDQLEEKQYVERRPHPTDRRVKALMLTEAGAELRKKLHDKLTEPPASLGQLTSEELTLLREVFQRLVKLPEL